MGYTSTEIHELEDRQKLTAVQRALLLKDINYNMKPETTESPSKPLKATSINNEQKNHRSAKRNTNSHVEQKTQTTKNEIMREIGNEPRNERRRSPPENWYPEHPLNIAWEDKHTRREGKAWNDPAKCIEPGNRKDAGRTSASHTEMKKHIINTIRKSWACAVI